MSKFMKALSVTLTLVMFAALILVMFAPATAQGRPLPSPPPLPGSKAKKKEEKKEEKKEGKEEGKPPPVVNHCKGKPGTKWCVPLEKCIKKADFEKECKKKELDCGELGTTKDANGEVRCNTLLEVIAEAIKADKEEREGPQNDDGSCRFGPSEDELDLLEAAGQPAVCNTFRQGVAAEGESHFSLWFMIVLGFGVMVGGSFWVRRKFGSYDEFADVTTKALAGGGATTPPSS